MRRLNRILVTGGAGFIGSNFVRHAFEVGVSWVTVVDKLTYAGRWENLEGAQPPSSVLVQCERDLANGEMPSVLSHLDREAGGFDAIVHFAAESHVDRSIGSPLVAYHSNLTGTLRLLEFVRTVHEQTGRWIHFHHVSTDEVFGDLPLGTSERFSEDSPYRPSSPYAASKAAADQAVRAYGRTYGLPFTISNCPNNYGPFQQVEKLIPRSITNLLQGHPIKLWNGGVNVRDWIHVIDHCDAIWRILDDGQVGETYLIGAESERSNLEIAKLICRHLESDPHAYIELTVGDRPGHDRRYAIDPGKIWSELGWEAQVDLPTGLAETVHWYREHPEWWQADKSETEALYDKEHR